SCPPPSSRASPPSPSTTAARVWISPSPDVREGNAVNLTCAVESGSREALSYTWYKNKVWFRSGLAPALTFPSVAATDAASYHCAVQTPARTRSSAPTTLNVLCEFLRAGGFMPRGEVPSAP
ncbi:SN protein, partial [Rhinoptilus africanus]|nr:SN protein [Rhinoptilus africanus]